MDEVDCRFWSLSANLVPCRLPWVPAPSFFGNFLAANQLQNTIKTCRFLWMWFNWNSPIAKNISFTFIAVLADVSMNKSPFSSAYCLASSYSTSRLVVKSALLPAKAITIFGEAFPRNTITQQINWMVNFLFGCDIQNSMHYLPLKFFYPSFSTLKTVAILYIVHNDGSLCSTIIHWS